MDQGANGDGNTAQWGWLDAVPLGEGVFPAEVLLGALG